MNLLPNRPVSRPVSEGEKNMLVELVSQAPAVGAGTASQVLARCKFIPAEQRAKIIATRLLREASVPPKSSEVRYMGTSFSREVYDLVRFVLALAAIEDTNAVLGVVKDESLNYGKNERAMIWALIAQGYMGSSDVASALKELVENEPDLSLKAIALRAYARSAGSDAIPLLERYLKESASSKSGAPIMIHRSGDALENAAHDELFLLRQKGGK